MAANIEEVLRRLRDRGGFGAVERTDFTGVLSHHDLLDEAYAVGKFRTDDFTLDEGALVVYRNIAKWIVGDPTMKSVNPVSHLLEDGDLTKGIYLAGRTGCGKTWAMDIMAFLAKEHRITYKAYGQDCVLDIKSFRADAITEEYMRSGDMGQFVEGTKVLLIQDLGTEPEEVLYMGNRVDVLRHVLERRADDPSRITLVTSNIPMTGDGITRRYGDRVSSRFRQMFNYLEMRGDDKRR